jgi:FAD/FMN-containing dehydrogenase/Fe-S oxidoreductase
MAVDDTPGDGPPDAVGDGPGTGAEAGEYADLAAALRERVSGGVEFGDYARVLYATDGSVYEAWPAGVVTPRDETDVRAAVRTASEFGVPILPRGAGSSLAGQAVGPGCVVLDCSRHMDSVLDVDADARRARVQPGVVQDDLDDRLAPHGLKFAPDPASSNRATVGGGIGNNSTGAHSVRYGITDAYVESVRAVLADGSVIDAREVVVDSPEWEALVAGDDREAELYRTVRAVVEEHADEIRSRYPELKRCVSGYNLHEVVYENGAGERCVNLAKLLVGSEGTLGVVVEATLELVTRPEETALVLLAYDSLDAAMRAVPPALDAAASAVELMDDEVFRLAADSAEYAEYVTDVPEGTAAALLVEFDSELHDDLAGAVEAATERFVGRGAAFAAVPALGADEQARLWKLRKAAIPLLMSMEGDPKPYPFIEDASVPPEALASYVAEFEAVLDDHDTSAAYFAHAGAGTLHVRPVLNLKTEAGVEAMRSIADDVTDLVLEHHGAFSGEHGDGLARTEFNPKMYGPDLWDAFKRVKSAFDPDWLMNPGKVVYRDDDPTDVREHLRYGADYATVEPATVQSFDDEGGFGHLVELCNGCGTCRQTGGEVMCPTYRATGEEVHTTRGRANLLRAAIDGDLPREELTSERFQAAVLDHCVGCKGCKRDCPTGVDLAKLRAEVKHAHHEAEGASLRDRLFADVDRVAAVGSALAPLSNWATDLGPVRAAMERLVGVAADRDLPTFRRETFVDWFEARGGAAVPASAAADRVLLLPDTYTNYSHPEVGRAAVRVLEAADVHVRVPTDLPPAGRAAYSKGFLELARERARGVVDGVAPAVREGWSVLAAEPSDAVMLQDEYRDLLSGPDVDAVAGAAAGVCEYLDVTRADERVDWAPVGESLAYHGHCNQTALKRDHHAVGVLRRAGYVVDPLDSTCCGMAGSFGYEAEHLDLSRAVGERLFERVDASAADVVVAPGASCRSQLRDRDGAGRPPHPLEKLAAAL